MEKNYMPLPPLIDAEDIEIIKTLNASLMADGMLKLGLPCGSMSSAISPVKEEEFMVGTALTVKTSNGDNLPLHVASYIQAKGYVMVVDGEGYDKCAYTGELLCTAVELAGYEGMVVDGLVRDRDEIKKLKLPIYSRGYMASGPVKKNPGGINIPVVCGGIQVNPGDLVIGSSNGVTVVPRDKIKDVIVKAQEKADYEKNRIEALTAYRKALEEGTTLPDLRPSWLKDMNVSF